MCEQQALKDLKHFFEPLVRERSTTMKVEKLESEPVATVKHLLKAMQDDHDKLREEKGLVEIELTRSQRQNSSITSALESTERQLDVQSKLVAELQEQVILCPNDHLWFESDFWSYQNR